MTPGDRSTADRLVLMFATTVCALVLLVGVALVVLEVMGDPQASVLAGNLNDVVNTLLGLLAGFLAGATAGKRDR
jgi:hypothetical protein